MPRTARTPTSHGRLLAPPLWGPEPGRARKQPRRTRKTISGRTGNRPEEHQECPSERENRREPASPQGPAPATTTVGFGARPAMPGPAAVVTGGRRSANLKYVPSGPAGPIGSRSVGRCRCLAMGNVSRGCDRFNPPVPTPPVPTGSQGGTIAISGEEGYQDKWRRPNPLSRPSRLGPFRKAHVEPCHLTPWVVIPACSGVAYRHNPGYHATNVSRGGDRFNPLFRP